MAKHSKINTKEDDNGGFVDLVHSNGTVAKKNNKDTHPALSKIKKHFTRCKESTQQELKSELLPSSLVNPVQRQSSHERTKSGKKSNHISIKHSPSPKAPKSLQVKRHKFLSSGYQTNSLDHLHSSTDAPEDSSKYPWRRLKSSGMSDPGHLNSSAGREQRWRHDTESSSSTPEQQLEQARRVSKHNIPSVPNQQLEQPGKVSKHMTPDLQVIP